MGSEVVHPLICSVVSKRVSAVAPIALLPKEESGTLQADLVFRKALLTGLKHEMRAVWLTAFNKLPAGQLADVMGLPLP